MSELSKKTETKLFSAAVKGWERRIGDIGRHVFDPLTTFVPHDTIEKAKGQKLRPELLGAAGSVAVIQAKIAVDSERLLNIGINNDNRMIVRALWASGREDETILADAYVSIAMRAIN